MKAVLKVVLVILLPTLQRECTTARNVVYWQGNKVFSRMCVCFLEGWPDCECGCCGKGKGRLGFDDDGSSMAH